MAIVYFLIALAATTIGAMTGMGGGVIIKPVLDAMGEYNAATIGVLSCITVLTMSIVSIGKQARQKVVIPWKMAIILATGSVVGGVVGENMLNLIIQKIQQNQTVVIVQNICLAILIAVVFLYMVKKDKIQSLRLTGSAAYIMTGCLLGFISSFLGIGGGPINVALLIYLYNLDTKTTTVCSIVTIFFAQISKLSAVMLETGLFTYDLSVLPFMMLGAVLGGWCGAIFNKKLSEKNIDRAFNAVQIAVFLLCILNIQRNLM